MGMFDEIRNDYKSLGIEFQGNLHTKDLDNLMDRYYLDPSGQLYLIDYSGTQNYSDNKDSKFPLVQCTPNGNRGRVMACTLTDCVVVYPSKWEGEWNELPEACIHFVEGKVQDFYHGKHFQISNTGRKAIPFKKEGGCGSFKKESCDCNCGKS